MTIKDSGTRHEFETGAVRDMQKGKGRCDLMPLAIIATVMNQHMDKVGCGSPIRYIAEYQETGSVAPLGHALKAFALLREWDFPTMFLETAIHFENGAEKYGEHNWQKGLPTQSFINSATRHYLKWLRGDDDEPHDRAFVWNVMCAMWTCLNKPELNSYGKVNE